MEVASELHRQEEPCYGRVSLEMEATIRSEEMILPWVSYRGNTQAAFLAPGF